MLTRDDETGLPEKDPSEIPKSRYSGFFKSSIIAVVYAIFSIALHFVAGESASFLSSVWFEILVPTVAFVGSHLSGATYIGSLRDLFADAKKRADELWRKFFQRTREFWGTLFSITVGIAPGIALSVLRFGGHFFTGGVTEILFNFATAIGTLIGCVGTFGGLGNRLSGTRNRKSILLGCAIGFGTSMALWFTGSAGITTIATVTSFLTGGAAVPFWLLGALFVISYTGAGTSAFDYHARAWNYLKYLKARYFDASTEEEKLNAEASIKKDFHQFRGAAIGLFAGIVVASIIIGLTGVLVLQPWLILPVALGVYFTCTGVFSGICARLGRDIDEYMAKKNPPAIDAEPPEAKALSPEVPEVKALPEVKQSSQASILAELTAGLEESDILEVKRSKPTLTIKTTEIANSVEVKKSSPSPDLFETLPENSELDSPPTATRKQSMAALIAAQNDSPIRANTCGEEEMEKPGTTLAAVVVSP